MRKIDDQELLNMMESGKSQKECAEHFSVSPSAINQRLKKLKPYEAPDSFTKLTDKQKAFVLAKVEGRSNLEAVKASFDVTTTESAKAMGTTLMKDPDIGRAIRDVLHEHGLSISHRIERLKWLVNHRDPTSVYRGLDMANKMTGDYAPVQIEHNIGMLIAHIEALQRAEQGAVDAPVVDVEAKGD